MCYEVGTIQHNSISAADLKARVDSKAKAMGLDQLAIDAVRGRVDAMCTEADLSSWVHRGAGEDRSSREQHGLSVPRQGAVTVKGGL